MQIDIDSGFGRCGVPMDDHDAIETLAWSILELPNLELDGLTTHRGLFFAGADRLTPNEAGAQEGELLVAAAERLRARGIAIDEVTAGGSLSGAGVEQVDGVTEVRAGTYVFNDLMQIALGVGDSTTTARSPSSPPWSAAPATTRRRSTAARRRSRATRGVVGGAGLAPPRHRRGRRARRRRRAHDRGARAGAQLRRTARRSASA